MECRKYKTRMIYVFLTLCYEGWDHLSGYKSYTVTPIRLWLRFFRRVFSFFSFHSGHVPDCVALRETSIALLLSRYCAGGPILNSGLKILIPTKTTRKAATMRFVVSSLVLDCIKGSYTGVFRGFSLNHVILSLRSKLHLNFTNVPLAVH